MSTIWIVISFHLQTHIKVNVLKSKRNNFTPPQEANSSFISLVCVCVCVCVCECVCVWERERWRGRERKREGKRKKKKEWEREGEKEKIRNFKYERCLVNVIIRLMFSVIVWPKVITISGTLSLWQKKRNYFQFYNFISEVSLNFKCKMHF